MTAFRVPLFSWMRITWTTPPELIDATMAYVLPSPVTKVSMALAPSRLKPSTLSVAELFSCRVPFSCTRSSWTPVSTDAATIANVSLPSLRVSTSAAPPSTRVPALTSDPFPCRVPFSCTRISWTALSPIEAAITNVLLPTTNASMPWAPPNPRPSSSLSTESAGMSGGTA